MFMVGWGFAFGRGIVIFFWSIVWAIVAAIIAVLVTGGTLVGFVSNPTTVASNPAAFLAAFFLGIFLSVFIAIIGLYASIVKVTVDGAISQIEKGGLQERLGYSMGSQPTLTAAPVLRKYCPNCGNSIPGGTVKCPSCGANL
jgi:zinc ribbon protein